MPASATMLAAAKKRTLRTNRNRDRLSVRLRFVIIGVRLCIPFAASEARKIPVALRDRNAIPMHRGRFGYYGRARQPRLQLIASQKSPITRRPGPALPATAKPHPDFIRAVLSACIANPIGVRALATRPDVIGVETGDVRHNGNQHAVTINVDIVRGSSIPRKVHRLPPLHLVAARTERDLPRCRRRNRGRICRRCGRGRCCRRWCRGWCCCWRRGCCWRRSRGNSGSAESINPVIISDIDASARYHTTVPLARAGHQFVSAAASVNNRPGVTIVAV